MLRATIKNFQSEFSSSITIFRFIARDHVHNLAYASTYSLNFVATTIKIEKPEL